MKLDQSILRARLLTTAATGLALLFTASANTPYAQAADKHPDIEDSTVLDR